MIEFRHEDAILLHFVIASVLTFFLGVAALLLLQRAILRNMMQGGGAGATPPADDRPRHPADAALAFDSAPAAAGSGRTATQLLWRHAVAHTLAGLAFAVVAAVVFLQRGGMEFYPLRTTLVVWAYGWPTVLMLGILVGRDMRLQALIVAGYFSVLLITCTISGLLNFPPLELAGVSVPSFFQPLVFWGVIAAPSAFLLLFLNRAIRSVGPLVLVFAFVTLLGAYVATALLLLFESILNVAVDIAVALHLGGAQAVWIFQGIGVLLAMGPAWLCVSWLRDRYAAKRSSDLLMIGSAIWLLMSLVIWNDLFRSHGALASLAAVLPWIAWRLTLYAAIRPALKEAREREPMRLLLLRVYGFGRRSRRLLDLLGTRWRLLGSIDLIAAPDLASRTVEPSTFLEFVRGRLKRLFIRTPEDLRARIAALDDKPDPDARFRINQLFCSDDMWKAAVNHLMGTASLVAMDLRGFGPHRRGCVYELETLLDTVPIDRLVFMIDWSTDRKGLEEILVAHWQRLAADSPNLVAVQPTLRLLDVGGGDAAAVRALLAIAEQPAAVGRTG